MKKKIFVGLLASVLVCFAVVFTNASSNSFSVSGTVEMSIDGDTPQPMSNVLIQLTDSQGSEISKTYTDGNGSFSISGVNSSNRVHYSYSDDWGSADSQEKQYFEGTNSERVTLHYKSHSSN